MGVAVGATDAVACGEVPKAQVLSLYISLDRTQSLLCTNQSLVVISTTVVPLGMVVSTSAVALIC